MKSNFEEKRDARLERFQDLATKKAAESDRLWKESSKMADAIPFGQPILIGHHSEGRDRNYREKIRNKADKSVQASRAAEYYDSKAESMLNNTAISSDDPDAIQKLTNKLEKLESLQELYKAINKIIKSKKLNELDKAAGLVKLGMKANQITLLMQPDFCGRIGIPSYRLTNNNGNMKRIKDRIAHLNKIESIGEKEESIGEVRIVTSASDNRLQIFFPDKPSEEVRTKLKSAGFRWAPSVGAWMSYISDWAAHQAKEIVQFSLSSQ